MSHILDVPEDDQQDFVRLVMLADNKRLRKLLDPETEVCGPRICLFMRVSPMCPVYYARWHKNRDETNMEIVDELPWSASRETILAKAWPRSREDGTDVSAAVPAICKIWLDRRAVSASRRGASAKPQAILVHPGDNVVRETDFITTSRDDVEADATTVAGGGTNETVVVRDNDGGEGDSSPANARPYNDEATGSQHSLGGGGGGYAEEKSCDPEQQWSDEELAAVADQVERDQAAVTQAA